MKFIVYLLEGMLVNLGDSIDTAFSNGVGIDVIVACQSFAVVAWFIEVLCRAGMYTYKIWRNRVRTCLLLSLTVSFVMGTVLFVFADSIADLFSLTEVQHGYCVEYMRVHAVGIPVMTLGYFASLYAMLKGYIKKLMYMDILYYGVMIGLDYLVVHNHLSVGWLEAATIFAWIVFTVPVVMFSGMLKDYEPVRLADIKEGIKHACNCLCDTMFGTLGAVIYNALASRLGTELYAVHSVCYAVVDFTECFADAFLDYSLVLLEDVKDSAKWGYAKLMRKKYRWRCVLGGALFIVPMILCLKGDVSFVACIGWVWLYYLEFVILFLHVSYKAYLTTMHESKCFRFAGLSGAVTRVLFVFVSFYLGCGLLWFALACTLDFCVRTLVYHRGVVKCRDV